MSHNKTLGKADAVEIAQVNIGLGSKEKTVCSVCTGAHAAQTRGMEGCNGNSLPYHFRGMFIGVGYTGSTTVAKPLNHGKALCQARGTLPS